MSEPRASTPRRVLVTGATAGIGRATATLLAARGHHVVPTGRRTAALETLVDDVRAAHGDDAAARLHPMTLDVNDPAACAGAPAAARELLGGDVEALVNNAGYSQTGPVELITHEELAAQLHTNVLAVHMMMVAFVPAMREARWGRIVQVSSLMAHLTLPLHGAYNASKAALDALSTSARMELRPQGIDVVLIEPGPINTEFESVAIGGMSVERATGTPYERAVGDAEAIYADFYKGGKAPSHTAGQVRRAIESARPRARYTDAMMRVQHLADRLAPVRVADAIKSRGVHL